MLYAGPNDSIPAEPKSTSADSVNEDQISYFYEPSPQTVGSSILQLGGSFTILPVALTEDEYPSPALDLQYKRGIFKNISLVASFSTNYFTNLLHSGLQWNIKANNFSFGLASHLGGFYGFLDVEGQFDKNSAYAFFLLPIVRFGYRFENFSVSVSCAASYIFRSAINVSGLKAAGPDKTINDVFCTLAIEQPFLKKSLISIGFSFTYERSPYQIWILYNTIDHRLFVPEFFFAVQL
jgi:hypothetical protein